MPREKGRKGTNGGRNLETLVKLAAPAIGTAAGAFTVVGIIYLGMTLAGLLRGGGGEIRKAVAIIVAGLTCIAFACHDLVPIHYHAPYLRCIEKEGHLFPDAPSTP